MTTPPLWRSSRRNTSVGPTLTQGAPPPQEHLRSDIVRDADVFVIESMNIANAWSEGDPTVLFGSIEEIAGTTAS